MNGRQLPDRAVCGKTLAMVWLATMALSACATPPGQDQQPAPDGVTSWVRGVDLSARGAQRPQSVAADNSENAQPSVYYGDDRPAGGQNVRTNRDEGPASTGSVDGAQANGQGYDLNFENTPINVLAKSVFSDILGVGYTIDPRVQATVSLSSGRPVPKGEILYVVESALRVNNVALVREARGYRLVPTADAVGTGGLSNGDGPDAGHGISVVPLQHVSAQTISKFLENFAAKPGMVRADRARNLVVIQGNSADRRAAIDAVLSFDADWMRGQSVGIYPISNSTPEPIIAEIEKIIDSGEGGMSHEVVKLQPIARQNAVLVVANRAQLLKTVATWITRLDRSGGAGIGVKVYRMRYGDAKQVAALLNDIFGNSADNGVDSAPNQIAPGSGLMSTRSGRATLATSQPAAAGGQQRVRAGQAQPSPAPAPDSFD